MSNVVQLSSQNFRIVGKSLTINFAEPMLVLFKMDSCPACVAFEPIFAQLIKEERRVIFGVHNISQDNSAARSSRTTSTPISAVPHLLLYKDGYPIAKFTGKRNIPSIKSFISKALQSAPPATQSFAAPQQRAVPQPNPQKTVDSFRNRGQPTGQAPSRYAQLGVDEEDEMKLLSPDQVLPYNAPWESYKRMGGGGGD